MTLKDFEELVPKIKKSSLPGIDSQFKLAPSIRKKLGKEINIEERNPNKAAVLSLLFPDASGEMQMVFMLRKTYKGVHSNQIGFPGGKVESSDNNLEATALRETYEEIGVSSMNITVLKELTDVYIPPSNFLVTPFLGILKERPEYILEENEVERLIEIPLKSILSDKSIASRIITTSYAKEIEVPVFKFDDEVIWGATAMMLSEIKDLILSE
ncbi:MAG: CoA pyrophosphatase [Flavobacteriaceae bacterium]|nr:CoA pyrophosphatase [Flavobacteriaceae bacterium]